ncbi:MAG: hypothetical protein HND43_03925 [Armatimonadetes bacterium]|uniref:Uncharacterized protein n=1 Tax=Candidatus Nitrosymbiomonas proteolyticus TaxID=2608984 RepID=A0A809S4X4_9BACT|nr:hypothetical protein [Armatimonadota bacterium]NOG38524.1 hypothetical protein [Armatimonadota bacterium]BBO23887.1 hypothetical protein NPRO_14820 [Candidatus Nitrosymbiomonas proteolyticus]GIK32139.1 MAG: hypothetical protein BroJett009_11310 [Armatimonadota bacterium]
MPVFHFSLGDSTKGPVGFCAAVRARNRRRAVAMLRSQMPQEVPVVNSRTVHSEGIEYVRVYLNPDAIAIADVDFLEQR